MRWLLPFVFLISFVSAAEKTHAKADTTGIKRLIDLAETRAANEKARYAEEAISAADSLLQTIPRSETVSRKTVSSLKEKASRLLAFHYRNQGNFEKELHYFKQCLALRLPTNDKRNIASAYVNIGISYYRMGYITRSLEHFSKAITLLEQINDIDYVATMYNNIGTVYKNQGETDDALDYFNRALVNYTKLQQIEGIAFSLNNIGSVHYARGEVDTALVLFNQAWQHALRSKSDDEKIRTLGNLAMVHRDRGRLDEALRLYDQMLELNRKTDNKPRLAAIYDKLANVHLLQKKYDHARKLANVSLLLCREQRNVEGLRNAEQTLAKIDSATGNFQAAFAHYQQFIIYRDSILNNETRKAAVKSNLKYEFDKKEAENRAIQQQKDEITRQEMRRQKLIRNGFIGGFAVVLLFAGIFFVQRSRIAKERQRSENLLLNILPGQVADELKDKGHADANLIEQVTVLFTDFKGFTAMSEKLSPEQLVKDLHDCFSAFDSICEKYGIEKIKTIGDAYMAAGGLPTPNSTHAVDVINAALAMREFVEKGKMKKVEQGLPHFEIRIGVHTGSVVAGIVGIRKFQYDIWGDTVNTASRMESSGEVGKVNISQTTYELVKDRFTCEYRGEIEAKGKGRVKMYFVQNG